MLLAVALAAQSCPRCPRVPRPRHDRRARAGDEDGGDELIGYAFPDLGAWTAALATSPLTRATSTARLRSSSKVRASISAGTISTKPSSRDAGRASVRSRRRRRRRDAARRAPTPVPRRATRRAGNESPPRCTASPLHDHRRRPGHREDLDGDAYPRLAGRASAGPRPPRSRGCTCWRRPARPPRACASRSARTARASTSAPPPARRYRTKARRSIACSARLRMVPSGTAPSGRWPPTR